eukprot:PhF_6_TR10677/c0_g1_i1/m.17256/K14815/MRT4; mRNA turnover protein 4
MPKSKRAKVVALTATKPKDRSAKDKLIDSIRSALTEYSNVYTFDYSNLRTKYLKELRLARQADSRMFLGNNRVMAVALGRNEEESVAPNLWKITKYVKGNAGLFFTNLPKAEVKKFFHEDFVRDEFARTGNVAIQDVVLPAGALPAETFPHNMVEQLTRLGLPVKLDRGIIHIREDTQICKAGVALTPESSQLLKLFGIMMVQFQVRLTSHWSNGVARKIATD